MTAEFVVVELEQGTSEWLAWRHQGIGSSQAQALMAKRGRGQGKENLLRDKLGNPVLNHGFQSNAMARGLTRAHEMIIPGHLSNVFI